jgi:YHS domain-containing protein
MEQLSVEWKDPVCGMTVSREDAPRAQHRGDEYRFCCEGCRNKFEADPVKYLAASEGAPQEPGDPGALYICPMCPGVEQLGPGTCPKCGMALERAEPSLEAAEDRSELDDMSRRFWIALCLSLPVFILAMSEMLPGRPLDDIIAPWIRVLLELLLSTPVVLWAGAPFFARAWQSLRARSPNMFTLVGGGVGIAYGYSLVAVLLPGLFPDAFRHEGIVAVYFEAAARSLSSPSADRRHSLLEQSDRVDLDVQQLRGFGLCDDSLGAPGFCRYDTNAEFFSKRIHDIFIRQIPDRYVQFLRYIFFGFRQFHSLCHLHPGY